MIGGFDTTFRTDASAEAAEGALRIILTFWPSAVIEDAESGEVLGRDFTGKKLPDELLIYRDRNAQLSWSSHGAIPENVNHMVHMLRGAASLTAVVDDPNDSEMRQLLAALREHVLQDIFWIRANAA